MRTIKEILIDANRYEDIVNILKDISKMDDNSYSYPVRVFIDSDGETKWRVDGKSVNEQSSKLLKLIEDGSDGISNDDFTYLSEYVRSHTDMLLHNYAITITHRRDPEDMETIRPWVILDNLISCWNLGLNDDDSAWDIPIGWKKLNYQESNSADEVNIKTINANAMDRLISTFEDMANRGTLLIGNNVTQEDLLTQIIGTIVKVMKE